MGEESGFGTDFHSPGNSEVRDEGLGGEAGRSKTA